MRRSSRAACGCTWRRPAPRLRPCARLRSTDVRPIELRRATGITRSELSYWRRAGLLTGRRTPGGHYRFQTRDLVRARVAVRLRRSGLSLRQTARALTALEAEIDLLVACDSAWCSTGNEAA